MRVGFISLGCSKNLVDTEMAIGAFKGNNFKVVNSPEEAEVLVINTCGFIESAKQEAIDTILEMAEYKENGICKYLIVMGCLVKRYIKELEKEMPEVDLFIMPDEYSNYWEKIQELIREDGNNNNDESLSIRERRPYELDYQNRVVTTGGRTAYLKIAEGCSNRCTYCAIPYIRGPYVSRKMEDILKEAKGLAKNGFKEIIVIAQDTTKYGVDIYGEPKLAELLQELCNIKEFEWIRFLYAYPESITDELIDTVKRNEKICKYFDIPVQHISNKILKLMNRPIGEKDKNDLDSPNQNIQDLIKKLKTKIPDVILRTSLIVGFPGEEEEDFNMLYSFVEQAKFDKIRSIYILKRRRNTGSKAKESHTSVYKEKKIQ